MAAGGRRTGALETIECHRIARSACLGIAGRAERTFRHEEREHKAAKRHECRRPTPTSCAPVAAPSAPCFCKKLFLSEARLANE
eukprot:3929309-Prymnesium_polylepis.2